MANAIETPKEVMSMERMGEIALMYVLNKVRKQSVPLDPVQMRRQIGNIAKDLDITYDEAGIFTETILFGAFNDLLEGIHKKEK